MSFRLPRKHGGAHATLAWTGMAFIVESMVLLLFLVASLCIITEVLSEARGHGEQGRKLAQAVAVATNVAERFAADPTSVEGTSEDNSLSVTCTVTSDETAAGTLYHAHITVRSPGQSTVLYELTTARYRQEVGS